MNAQLSKPKSFEFCFAQLDTLALVENQKDTVVIRLTRDTFSEERKTCFVRELAAEGFIPDAYRWSMTCSSNLACRVLWLIDRSWLKLDPRMIAGTRRFMFRFLAGGLLLWVVLMTALLYSGDRPDLSTPHSSPTMQTTHG